MTLLAVRRRIRSQTCRQCLPHLKHSNRFVSSSMTPPHSGQRQFTIADIASGSRLLRRTVIYPPYSHSAPVDCRPSARSTSVPQFKPAICRPFGSSARNTAEYSFASSCPSLEYRPLILIRFQFAERKIVPEYPTWLMGAQTSSRRYDVSNDHTLTTVDPLVA